MTTTSYIWFLLLVLVMTWQDDHFYRTPDEIAGFGHYYDDYNRSWPPVFV